MTSAPNESEPDEDLVMVEIELSRIVLRDHSVTSPQYILLREVGGERSFPIIIGYPEASEIQRVVTGFKSERPMTHELLFNVMATLGARLARVEIIDVRNNTFYAKLQLENEKGEPVATLDARPSDSIALATRARCPIHVTEGVLELVRTDLGKDQIGGGSDESSTDPPPNLPGF